METLRVAQLSRYPGTAVIVTDSQIHMWKPEDPNRPWPPGGRERAHRSSFTVNDAISEMDAAGVDRAVLVPPSWEGDRNDTCLAAAASYPDRFRVMGRLSLADPRSRGILSTWLSQPGMVGIRHTFAGPTARWLDDGTADWFWAEAERARIPVMVYCPGLLDRIAEVAEKHHTIPIIIDHCGLGPDTKDAAIDPVIDVLVRLSRFPNINVKASSLPSNTSERYPFPNLQSRIERVVNAFGPRRVFWGSDVTRIPCTYEQALRYLEELDFLDAEDLNWIMGDAISELLNWPVPPGIHSTGNRSVS